MQNWRENSKGTQALKIDKQSDERLRSTFVDELTQSLCVGTTKSILNQINLRSLKVIKRYEDLGIGSIRYLSAFQNLLIAGGFNYSFTLISITERRVMTVKPVETSFEYIKSSLFTVINRNDILKLALSVCGCNYLFLYF